MLPACLEDKGVPARRGHLEEGGEVVGGRAEGESVARPVLFDVDDVDKRVGQREPVDVKGVGHARDRVPVHFDVDDGQAFDLGGDSDFERKLGTHVGCVERERGSSGVHDLVLSPRGVLGVHGERAGHDGVLGVLDETHVGGSVTAESGDGVGSRVDHIGSCKGRHGLWSARRAVGDKPRHVEGNGGGAEEGRGRSRDVVSAGSPELGVGHELAAGGEKLGVVHVCPVLESQVSPPSVRDLALALGGTHGSNLVERVGNWPGLSGGQQGKGAQMGHEKERDLCRRDFGDQTPGSRVDGGRHGCRVVGVDHLVD